MSTDAKPPLDAAAGSALKGRKWKAVINGKKSINGARYGVTYTGDVADAGEGQNLYDVLMGLAEYLEEKNAEMEFPDSYQVTLFPPNASPSATGKEGQQ